MHLLAKFKRNCYINENEKFLLLWAWRLVARKFIFFFYQDVLTKLSKSQFNTELKMFNWLFLIKLWLEISEAHTKLNFCLIIIYEKHFWIIFH